MTVSLEPVRTTGPRDRLITAAPTLFALALVLTVYADSGSALEALPRPLAVAAIGALAVQLVASIGLRSVRSGSLAALMVLGVVVSPLWGITAAVVAVAVILFGRWRQFPTTGVVSFAGTVAAIAFTIALARVVVSPAFDLADLRRVGPVVGGEPVLADPPDIFLIMLDGYPRSDTLAGWGYQNAWFTQAMTERGFSVAGASHSNYPLTALALSTMFHMRHVDEIDALTNVPAQPQDQKRAIRTSLTDTPALRRLGELGYETITAGRPGDYITLNTNHLIDAGWLNEFEHQVLSRTSISGMTVPLILDARRGEILETLRAAPTVAEDAAPTFMFAHVVSPHLPFLFDDDGGQPVISCVACTFATHIDHSGMSSDEFLSAYADQVDYLNHLVLEAVDGIVERSPKAIVVVFSDHGSRANRTPDADWYATLFASRTPGHSNVFPDDARPIEIFPRLFEEYFGDEIPIPEDVDFLAPDGVQMPLEIVPRTATPPPGSWVPDTSPVAPRN